MSLHVPYSDLRKYSNTAQSLRASGTSKARAAANRLKDTGQEVFDLTIGELAVRPDEAVTRGAAASIHRGDTRYTDTIGLAELRDRLAVEMTAITGLDHDRSNIAINAGAKPGLFITWQILLERNDEVLLPVPYWQTFPYQIRLVGGCPLHVPHLPDGQLDVDAMKRAITTRTKALLVNTPNNPTGAVYSKSTLQALAELALENGLWIVFDQCYRNFTYDDFQHHHILELEPDLRDRTITIDSFSKALAIAGWRVGYTAGPSDFIDAMRSFQSHITSCANTTAQHAALAYLQTQSDRFSNTAMAMLAENRRIGLSMLGELKEVLLPHAQGGFYFYLNVRRILERENSPVKSCEELCTHLLETAGVAAVSGSAFGDPDAIRISYAVRRDDLTVALPRLIHSLNSLGQD